MCTGSHPFIPASQVARVSYLFNLDGVAMMNVINYRGAVPWTPLTIASLAEDSAVEWGNQLNAVVSDKMSIINVTALDLSSENSYVSQYVPPGIIRGTLPDDIEGNAVAFKIKFGTGLSGRNYIGGLYHAGITKPQTNGRYIDATIARDIKSGWQTLIENVEIANGCEHHIVSYCYHNAWRSVAVTQKVLNYSYTNLLLDSQRRRKQ